MDISFYAVRNTSIEKTLPKLVEKIYDAGFHIHILCDSDEQLKTLDASLWTFSSMAFLPHGTPYDPVHMHHENPIWLSTTLDLKNKPDVLILLAPWPLEKDWAFKKIIFFFDANREKNNDFENAYQESLKFNKQVIFWQQTSENSWEKREAKAQI